VGDPLNGWRRQELLWSLRWLAAEPEAALAAVPGVVTADEIALDIGHWLEIARELDLLDQPVLSMVVEIDRQFASMSGAGNDARWTDQALRTSSEWAMQRERARSVLSAMGESRADDDLGKTRPGGPTYVTAARWVKAKRSGGDIPGR
jgi:hypothetical protein